jgi:hypothetical protein
VSTSFYGLTADNKPIMLEHEDPAYFNMNNRNAHAFLELLGFPGCHEPNGEASRPEARRAIMRARGTFEKRVENFVREGSDTQRPGRCRVIQGGNDESYFARRIEDFERFLNAVVERGATSVYWA